MTESQNLVPNCQTPDTSHPISHGAEVVERPVDVVAASDRGVTVELGSGRVGREVKRKRGRPSRVQVKLPQSKKNKEEEEEEEDVCFICFDGGSLVLCDRRGCPKAYHPACIKRDEAFFESAAKWDCGWHICSICQKSAHHMCYTCTYSLCRACIRKADYVCVRGDKGFCTVCMKTIMLIENNGQGEDGKEECIRLQQSIKCGLVKHFTVGEIQEKAVALQSVKLNDWIEKEMLRLNHLCDIANEKGNKKDYRECMEKLQLLKTPDERDRKLQEIPEVHSDPKMNPDYELDGTEEYFNKENGDHMESKHSRVSSKNPRSRKKLAGSTNDVCSRSMKKAQSKNSSITMYQNVKERFTPDSSRICFEKDASGSTSTSGNLQNEVDCNGSTITKLDHQPTSSPSATNSKPEPVASSLPTSNPDEMVWHYFDPNGNVQGPFSLELLRRWSTTGYFPADMKIWTKHEDKSLLLNDVLKEQFSENITADNKASNQTERVIVCSANPSSTIAATPQAPNPINLEKSANDHGSSGQTFGQNWSANSNFNSNPQSVASLTMSNESTEPLNTSNTPTEIERDTDIRHLPTASKDSTACLLNLPAPAPQTIREDEKMQSVLDSKPLIQDSGNPPSWSSASSLVVGGAELPVSAGCSSTPVKHEEWDSGIDRNIQPTCNDLSTWHGMSEMIEFSTLAEESVSDLLAEVDAMESQYGLPSPTSRRNSFVDYLFNDDFSPVPDQGTGSDGFSSNGLQQHSLMSPEINAQIEPSYGIPQGENPENAGFKWPDMEKARQEMIDINRSARAEGDDGEMETKNRVDRVNVEVENGNDVRPVAQPDSGRDESGGVVAQTTEPLKSGGAISGERLMQTLKTACAKLVTKVAQGTGLDPFEPEAPQPLKPSSPPPPLTLGLDPFVPNGLGLEKNNTSGNMGWDPDPDPDPNRYGAERERHNTRSHHQVDDSGRSRNSRNSWNNKQSSSIGGDGGGSGGGSSRPPSKGQRICRLNESGRCKKGASCKYLHR